MAQIRTFRCMDRQCRYVVRLAEGFPVWHPQTPERFKKLPVPADATEYVIGYRSELLCRYCIKTVHPTADHACPHCDRGGIYNDEGGRLCPQCMSGSLSLEHQSVI